MSVEKHRIRRSFRDRVFQRDRYRCAVCGHVPELGEWGGDHPPLDAHHITDRKEMPNGGYVVENGISLCGECHRLAEAEHRGEEPGPGFRRAELYGRIGSSYERALRSSERLGGRP